MKKTLNVTGMNDCSEKVSDVEVFGDPSQWVLICKASSQAEGWMKSTKAMDTRNGCLILVTTQQGDQVSEALAFVPVVRIKEDKDGNKFINCL